MVREELRDCSRADHSCVCFQIHILHRLLFLFDFYTKPPYAGRSIRRRCLARCIRQPPPHCCIFAQTHVLTAKKQSSHHFAERSNCSQSWLHKWVTQCSGKSGFSWELSAIEAIDLGTHLAVGSKCKQVEQQHGKQVKWWEQKPGEGKHLLWHLTRMIGLPLFPVSPPSSFNASCRQVLITSPTST